jgi:hypothetical protein
MQDEERAAPDARGAEAAESKAGRRKAKSRRAEKAQRSHSERAMANIRAAKKRQREVSDPVERARISLAEANVLALLELADAIASSSGANAQAGGESARSE